MKIKSRICGGPVTGAQAIRRRAAFTNFVVVATCILTFTRLIIEVYGITGPVKKSLDLFIVVFVTVDILVILVSFLVCHLMRNKRRKIKRKGKKEEKEKGKIEDVEKGGGTSKIEETGVVVDVDGGEITIEGTPQDSSYLGPNASASCGHDSPKEQQ